MTNEEKYVATAIASWKQAIGRVGQLTSTLDDAQLHAEVSPGRNRVYYLIGHLAVVHDRLFPMLGLGERLHPELDEQFVNNPDRKIGDTIPPAELRKTFNEVNSKLTAPFEALPVIGWLEKHTAVSDEDFQKEPLRNRLAVLQSRTGHAMFHAGQIRLMQ